MRQRAANPQGGQPNLPGRLRPASALSRWYERRFGSGNKRAEGGDRGPGAEGLDRVLALPRTRGVAGGGGGEGRAVACGLDGAASRPDGRGGVRGAEPTIAASEGG